MHDGEVVQRPSLRRVNAAHVTQLWYSLRDDRRIKFLGVILVERLCHSCVDPQSTLHQALTGAPVNRVIYTNVWIGVSRAFELALGSGLLCAQVHLADQVPCSPYTFREHKSTNTTILSRSTWRSGLLADQIHLADQVHFGRSGQI